MRISKLVLFLVIGLAVFAVVAVTALLFVDPTVFRGQIETRASAAFGRQFQIDGAISLERSLRPRIVIEDISIGNPAWATGEHFAKVEKAQLLIIRSPRRENEERKKPAVKKNLSFSSIFPTS